MTQSAAVPTFVQRYTTESRQHSMQQLVNAESARQLRSATLDLGRTRLARELARRAASQTRRDFGEPKRPSGAIGVREDQLQYRTRSLFGWRNWQRIGDRVSTASAREFDSDYSGVPAYYNVAGSPATRRCVSP